MRRWSDGFRVCCRVQPPVIERASVNQSEVELIVYKYRAVNLKTEKDAVLRFLAEGGCWQSISRQKRMQCYGSRRKGAVG